MSILNQINGHDDLKGLHADQRVALCADIREAIVNVVKTNGGHLSSNLGVVELTVALYTVFDPIRDVIIWDVGHQTYAHKLLTGRQSAFNTLRKKDGLSGFPKTRESEADGFVAGHASNSVSAALGLARARDLKKEEHRIVAVIGDGALTGGMAYEALNDAGQSESDLLVILNDNAMSISDNVGGVNNMLSRMRTRPGYLRFKTRVKKTLQHVPMVGRSIMRFAAAVRDKIKFFVLPRRFFEEIGFTYIGPMDGHDTEGLIEVFSDAAKFKGPLFLHLITKKGKGMQNAELDPIKFHSVSVVSGTKAVSNSAVVGNVLIDIAAEDSRVVAITAAMKTGTGLQDFARLYPDRFFDVGIAEQHAVTLAAGMAAGGLRPYAAIYATFLQRAYDQILQDVCLPCLPMCF
ncbi:MAG: 1-deoxy-D-xylulose-5-phosphate synthase, partial [Clostridia bacterium]|nr:1-deoxy-D-xylulose-5-phosphate synthase [Clostridia bacterium]